MKPFFVIMYGGVEEGIFQFMLKKIKGETLTLYLDATGGVVRVPSQLRNATILYYALVISTFFEKSQSTDPVAITSMISFSHNTETIGNWLRLFRIYCEKKFKKWPLFNEVVIDFSFALLNSVLDGFNRIDVIEYIKYCYSVVTGEENNKKYIRIYLCYAHLSHNLSNDINAAFKSTSKANKIIKEIIASLFIINDYEKIKYIFMMIIRLLTNKYITEEVTDALNNVSKKIFDIENVSPIIFTNVANKNNTPKNENDFSDKIGKNYLRK